MTPRESECLMAIKRYWHGHACSPTFQELADSLGIASKSGVSRLVKSLANQGHLRRSPGLYRSLQPVSPRIELAARKVVESGRLNGADGVTVDPSAFFELKKLIGRSWHV